MKEEFNGEIKDLETEKRIARDENHEYKYHKYTSEKCVHMMYSYPN